MTEIDKGANARAALVQARAAKAVKDAAARGSVVVPPRSFRVEVQTTGPRGPWNGNDLRFSKEADAQSYGADLFTRWTQVTAWRVSRCDEPGTHRWNGHMAVPVEAEERAA